MINIIEDITEKIGKIDLTKEQIKKLKEKTIKKQDKTILK